MRTYYAVSGRVKATRLAAITYLARLVRRIERHIGPVGSLPGSATRQVQVVLTQGRRLKLPPSDSDLPQANTSGTSPCKVTDH